MNAPTIPSGFNPTAKQGCDKTSDLTLRAQHADDLEWLNRLNENKDFQRFVDFVKARAKSALDKSGDIDNRSAEARAAYSQQAYGISKIAHYVDDQIAASIATIKAIDDRLRKV